MLAAVSDGAGSQPLSQYGSRIAVEIAVKTLRDTFIDDLRNPVDEAIKEWLAAAFRRVFERLETEAKDRNVAILELATTLIAVVAGPGLVAAMQVGDGAVVVSAAGEAPFALTEPENGEYLDLTSFVTDEDSLRDAQFRLWHGNAAGVAAFTDGLQMQILMAPRDIQPNWVPHAAFFVPFFAFTGAAQSEETATDRLKQYLISDSVREKTGDDVTLLVASRIES